MPDQSIALQVQTPNPLTTVGNLLSVAGQAQGLKSQQQQIQSQAIGIEQAKGALDARKAVAGVISDPQFRGDDGQFDLNKGAPALMQADPRGYIAPQLISGIADSRTATTTAAKAGMEYNSNQWDKLSGGLGALLPQIVKDSKANPTDLVTNMTMGLLNTKIVTPRVAGQMLDTYPFGGSKADQVAWIKNHQMSAQNVATQVSQQNQPPIPYTTGQRTTFQPTPLSTNAPPAPIQQVLPPTTPVFNPTIRAPGYLGPGTGTATGGAPLQSAPALGAPEATAGTVQTINAHWNQVNTDANSAQTLQGIAENVKNFAHIAVTGTAHQKLTWVDGMLATMRVPGTGDIKTDTDLLEKNMAMLTNNSPLSSDMARVIKEASSPHPTMSEQAIKDASNQLIGQMRMSMDARRFLLPAKQQADQGNLVPYNQNLVNFSQNADARIWQFQAMNPEEQKNFWKQLPPDQRAAFRAKATALTNMGIFQR